MPTICTLLCKETFLGAMAALCFDGISLPYLDHGIFQTQLLIKGHPEIAFFSPYYRQPDHRNGFFQDPHHLRSPILRLLGYLYRNRSF